uniref:lysophospholipase n=1 Tax=Biomphalaria glabrata TaxID=6526 RepID=A0A2C9M5X0_BIOGL
MSTNTSAVTNVQLWVSELTMSIVVSIIVIAVTVLVILFFGVWKYKLKVLPSQTEATKRYRFRKRDKVMFFGRKMLRKVKSFTRNTVGGPGGGMRRKPSHKQMIARIRSAIEETRFLAHRKDPSKPRLKQQSPPQSFLEADWSDINDDHRLPPEVLYMLRSIRVFGHLEKPFFLELCRYMETITLRAGHFLFKIGDPDDSIYVVQNGMLEVYITDVDGTEHLIKQVATGNSIHSLLSILDVLTGHPGSFKSVSARAVTDSTILRLPAHAFKSMFEKFNQSAVKVVQIIMIRLQRVTFSALHNYLGLSKELLKSDVHVDPKDLHIHRINCTGTGSPNMGSPLRHPPNSNIEPTKDEDSSFLGITIGTAHKKPLISRPLSESGSQLSDFDAALMRARASVSDDKSIVLSGSPPRKVNFTQPGFSESSPSSSYRSRNIPDEEMILNLALKDLISILGLKDPSLLDCRVKLSFVSSGSLLCKQGDQDTSLFFLVKGTISVLQNVVGESGKEVLMFHAEPGEIIDVLSVLTGEPSFFTMRARTDAIMAIITKQDFYQIMRIEPFIVLNLAHCTVKRMSPFVRQIDFALDWQMLEAGKALFRQGDTSDSIFIVLTGRLRSVITLVGGKKELVNEFGRGELVGIVEVLTQNERATTVLAIRDTELAKIPAELLNLIKLRYPQVVARLIHLLGTSILGNLQQKNTMTLQTSISRESDAYSKMERTTVANLSTIAIVPVTEDVPTTNFALELQHALLTIGPTVRLTPDIVKARLGEAALDSVNEFSLFNWLSQQEDIHRMCLYQCDYQLTKWSKHCLKQADCILIVGLAHKEPTIGPIEKELESIAVRAQKELILLHKEDTESPKNTAEWLNVRGWLSSHHHIRCPKRVLRSKSPAKTVPDMTEIQSRLAYVSCVRQLEVVKNSDYCEYIRPPIDRYATLQFGSFDEIVETGYHHGKTLFSAWSKGGLQDKLFKDSELLAKQSKAHKERNLAISQIPVMAYFTDLAEQVSKIENPKSTFYLSADSEEEVIDEDDEDPAHMLEGYEEDDEFARSDQDEEISDDETCVKSKVTSIITPLYRLGVISQSSLISLRGTLSDTTELKHPTVRLGKNSADSLNYRMKPHKSSALPAKISKPSFTQEQIDALANDESLLAFLITPWAFSSRGGADDVDQLKSGPSCQADLFKKVNSVATTLKYKPDQVLSDSLLNEADLNWVKSQLFKTNSLQRIQLRKTVSCKDIGSVSRNIHEIDDPEPQVCANISKVRPTGSAESFLEIPNQQVQLATDAEKKVKFSNTPETKIPLCFKSCVNDIHKDVRRGDAPAQQNVNKPCLLIAKDVGTENSHSLQNKDVGLDKPRHHVKDVGAKNPHTLQNKDVGLDKPCLFLCKDLGSENSHTLQNKDVGLDKPCLFLCKDVGTENSHTLQNKDVGLDKPCLFLCKDVGTENSHTLQNKDVGLDKPCLFLCKDVGTENSHTLQNKDVGLDKPCLFLSQDVGIDNFHDLQKKDIGIDTFPVFETKDVGINPVMQSKVICPEAAESFHHLNVNTDLNQMSETEGISVESLGLNKIYICTDSSQVKEMNNASGCILKHPHTLLAFNINSDVSSQHQEVDSISRTAHTFFTPIKETLGQPENVFTDKSPPQSTHVEDRIEKPQAHILDSCKNKSPSKSVELMKKKHLNILVTSRKDLSHKFLTLPKINVHILMLILS